ncbi:MAG: TetR family transcriptional regulator [Mycobacterium sp.]
MSRQEQARATRAALIDAARELWSANGFFATSTSDIVTAAAVGTRGAFYAHFPDREQLFLAVLEDVSVRLSAELEQRVTPAGDPLTDLRAVLLAFLDIVVEAPDVQALLVDGPAVFGPARWHQAEQARGLVPIEQRITAAIAAGVIAEQPVRPLAMILLMLVNDTALMITAAADRAVARRDAGAALAQLISGLRTDH